MRWNPESNIAPARTKNPKRKLIILQPSIFQVLFSWDRRTPKKTWTFIELDLSFFWALAVRRIWNHRWVFVFLWNEKVATPRRAGVKVSGFWRWKASSCVNHPAGFPGMRIWCQKMSESKIKSCGLWQSGSFSTEQTWFWEASGRVFYVHFIFFVNFMQQLHQSEGRWWVLSHTYLRWFKGPPLRDSWTGNMYWSCRTERSHEMRKKPSSFFPS